MSKLFHLLLITIVLSATSGNCQDSSPPFRRVVKFYPLQLYRVFPTAAVGYEQRIGNRFSITAEVAPFLNLSVLKTDYHSKHGVRLREELRYYFKYKFSKTRSTHARGMYAGTEFHQVSARYSKFSEEFKWKEAGFGFKVGMAEFLNRITLDYAVGVSFRYAKETPPDLWASMINFWEERFPVVQPTLSFGVGYKF